MLNAVNIVNIHVKHEKIDIKSEMESADNFDVETDNLGP